MEKRSAAMLRAAIKARQRSGEPETTPKRDLNFPESSGAIESLDYPAGTGEIALDDGRRVQFNAKDVIPTINFQVLRKGHRVIAVLAEGRLGPQVMLVRLVGVREGAPFSTQRNSETDDGDAVTMPSSGHADDAEATAPSASSAYLAGAILARDAGRLNEAIDLYERGLKETPSVHIVLSYAAMLRNRHRDAEAMRVYERGIKLMPRSAKLREDAGTLARKLGDYSRATRLLEEALGLVRSDGQGGQKGLLEALGRTYFEIGSQSSLRESLKYYQAASDAFAQSGGVLSQESLNTMRLAAVRVHHHRGDVTARFLAAAQLKIRQAKLFDNTVGAQFIFEIDDQELRESYNLAETIVLHCLFKGEPDRADLAYLDSCVHAALANGFGDDQTALLVVGSLSPDLSTQLFRRIEQRRENEIAIVPLQQTDLETSKNPIATLRQSLDRWLYRRDLFADNSWVQGRRFFGRAKPLAEISDAVASATPLGVFGLRKVGKTSLLKEVQRRASEAGHLVVYLDLLSVPADVNDCTWLYWHVAGELRREAHRTNRATSLEWRLGGRFRDIFDIPKGFPVATALDSDVRQLLTLLSAGAARDQKKIILLLDEIERLLPNELGKSGFEGFFDFFSYWRGISQQYPGFVFVVTGANPSIAETSQFEGKDNPVFSFLREVYLELLEPAECAAMIRQLGRGMGIEFDTPAINAIYSLTGGHPFLTRRLCSFVAAQFAERPCTISRFQLTQLTGRYLAEREVDFREILDRLKRDYPDEFDLCVELARAGGALPLNAVRRNPGRSTAEVMRHLIGYRLAVIRGPNLLMTIDLLRQWLNQRYGATDAAPIHSPT